MTKTESRRKRKIYQSVGRTVWIWPHFPKHSLCAAPPSSLKHNLSRSHSCPVTAANPSLGQWQQQGGDCSLTPPLPSLLWGPRWWMGSKDKHLYSTEGANAAPFWWSLFLLYTPSRAGLTSGRCPYMIRPGMQDMWKSGPGSNPLWAIQVLPCGGWGEHLQGAQALHSVTDLPEMY